MKQNKEDLSKALEIFCKYNIFEDCKRIASQYVNKSKVSLEQFPNTQIKDYLIGMANESIDRSN